MAEYTPQKINDSFDMSNFLSSYADQLKESTDPDKQIASSMIYAGLAEFFCDIFIQYLSKSVENSRKKVLFKAKKFYNGKNTNLESALRKLEFFDYPNKTEIEEEIKLIKDSRNDLFHNLVRAREKNISLRLKIVLIQDHVPNLRNLISKSLLNQI